MKKTLLLLFVFHTCLWVHANETLTPKAKAFEFIQKHKSPIAVSDLTQVPLADSLGFFAFNIRQNDGFVLVSKKGSNAILGYSTTGHFAWDELPNNATNWMMGYQTAIVGNKAIENGNQLKAVVKDAVEPLCDSDWWQYTYYNRKCPVNVAGDTAVTGCVATAMGIIMKKWNYPPKGTGSIAYTDARFGSVTANFEESVYDWQNMPTTLTEESTPEQIEAVGTLLADCAKALKSSFGNYKQGTEARVLIKKNYPTENAEYAFKNFFGYDASSIQGVMRSRYTTRKWMELIKKELSEGRPVIYNGTSETATVGHCFVCDGYDKDGFFHFNWGFNGDMNGYFSIDSMTPYKGYDFSYNQEALIGIMPPSSYCDNTKNITEQSTLVQIYPNPTTDKLYINLPEGKNNINLYLVNVEGNIVKGTNTSTIDVSNLSKGIYILTGFINGYPFAKKVEVR